MYGSVVAFIVILIFMKLLNSAYNIISTLLHFNLKKVNDHWCALNAVQLSNN